MAAGHWVADALLTNETAGQLKGGTFMNTARPLTSGKGNRLSIFAVCVALCATSVALIGGSAASAAAAPASAAVTGVVSAGGHAVSSAAVSLYNADTNAKLGTTTTSANGTFTETGITVPRVKVGVVKAGWATTYAFDKYTLASANVFWLTAGQKLTLPKAITLYPEAVIEGQVLGWMDPVSNATVTVYNADTDAVVASTSNTFGDAEYRFGGLPAGHYKVGATAPGWLPGFANGQSTLASATVYWVGFGQTLRQLWDPMVLYIDLNPAGFVDGSVMGIDNDPVWGWDDPLGGVTVSVLNASTGAVLGTATTNSLGEYSVGGLAPGDVKVRFSKDGWLTTTTGVHQVESFVGLHLGELVIYSQPAVMGQVLGTFDPLGGATVTVYDANTGQSAEVRHAGQWRVRIPHRWFASWKDQGWRHRTWMVARLCRLPAHAGVRSGVHARTRQHTRADLESHDGALHRPRARGLC